MTYPADTARLPLLSSAPAYASGLILVALTAASAYGLRQLPLLATISPMIIAIVLGMLFSQYVGVPAGAKPGIDLAGKRILRFAVALLGLQITYAQLAELGILGIALAAVSLGLTFLFTLLVGRWLGVDAKLTQLIAGGTAVCGASAVAAVNATVEANEEDVAYAVACVTLFGTLAMILYPSLITALQLEPTAYGAWVGLSVHEVAQVVGAGYQGGSVSGEAAVVTKLARVLMLAPLVLCVAFSLRRSAGRKAGAGGTRIVPGFVIGFLALALVNSLGLVPHALRELLVAVIPVLLTVALAALGLGTNFSKVRERGLRPILLGALSFVFIAAASLLMVKLAM